MKWPWSKRVELENAIADAKSAIASARTAVEAARSEAPKMKRVWRLKPLDEYNEPVYNRILELLNSVSPDSCEVSYDHRMSPFVFKLDTKIFYPDGLTVLSVDKDSSDMSITAYKEAPSTYVHLNRAEVPEDSGEGDDQIVVAFDKAVNAANSKEEKAISDKTCAALDEVLRKVEGHE